jgi:hypothetical protein
MAGTFFDGPNCSTTFPPEVNQNFLVEVVLLDLASNKWVHGLFPKRHSLPATIDFQILRSSTFIRRERQLAIRFKMVLKAERHEQDLHAP